MDLEACLPLQFYWKSQYHLQMGLGTLVLKGFWIYLFIYFFMPDHVKGSSLDNVNTSQVGVILYSTFCQRLVNHLC